MIIAAVAVWIRELRVGFIYRGKRFLPENKAEADELAMKDTA